MPERAPLDGTVGLAMYPFEELQPWWQQLWSLIQRRLPWLPAELTWHTDLHDAWRSPEMLVDQTCGWPLVRRLADVVQVVGAFEYDVPEAEGPTYRSVLVAREPRDPSDVVGVRAAVNDDISLSGWVSLLAAVHGPGSRWEGPVVWTGAHVDSVRAVRDGRAEVASIDAVTWAHLRRLDPELVSGLHEIGHGPRVPTLPVIAGARLDADDLDALRSAIVDALADPAAGPVRERLLIRGFVPLDLAAYLPLHDLAPAD